jgi:hypothetical protein
MRVHVLYCRAAAATISNESWHDLMSQQQHWREIKTDEEISIEFTFVLSLVPSLVYTFVRLFVPSFVRLILTSYVRLFLPSFICSFVSSFVCSFISSFVYLFVCFFLRLFVCFFLCLFVPSFPFVRTFVRSFVRSSHTDSNWSVSITECSRTAFDIDWLLGVLYIYLG